MTLGSRLVELSVSIAVTDSVSSLRWTCTRLDFCDPATSRLIVLLPGGVGGLGGDLEFLLEFLANDGNSFGDVALGSSPLLFCKVGSRNHS